MRDDMHFLSSGVRAVADQPTPHKVAASEVVERAVSWTWWRTVSWS